MKKKLDARLCLLSLLFALVGLLPACKKNSENSMAPVITAVRNYVASPNDTVLHSAVANTQWVVITGHNLQNATQIDFDGVPATFNTALFAPNSAVVQIPTIAFSTIDTAKLYTLTYTTPGGTTTFSFKLGPAAPTITAISNVFATPGDSVYLYGANLVLVQHFVYGGTKISSFNSSPDGTALGFLMPAATPTNQIVVTTKSGTVLDTINATPTITSISDENASPGDSVYIYGTYFKSIQAVTFAGTAITSFTSSATGNSIGFVMPSISQSGPASVTTKFGTVATVYNVNDVATGAISNWEWSGLFNWEWYGGSNYTSGSPDFPGNSTQYMVLKTGILAPGEGNTYSNYAILMNAEQWVPAANLNDPPSKWAFKFEVSVPQPWNGGSIIIQTGFGSFIYRWEPWQKTGSTAAYTTTGLVKNNSWITVTIPLSSFKTTDPTLGAGEGAPVAQITDLTGPSGNTSTTVYIYNYGTAATATGFYGAFDNFRCVKIK